MAVTSERAPQAEAAPVPPVDGARPARPGAAVPVALALLLLAGVTGAALVQGPTHIGAGTVGRILLAHVAHVRLGEWPASAEQIVWQIRAPRVLLAMLVGAVLAASGTAYQGVFRNPLADPYLIGVAAGAGLGATIVFVSPASGSWHGLSLVTPAAFTGAVLAVALAFALARGGNGPPGTTLILAGVAIAALCSATTSFLFFFNDTRLPTVFAWLMGGFNTSTWSRVWLLAPYGAIGVAILFLYARLLNVLLLDDEQARQVGVEVERVRLIILGAASLAAAAAVSVSGLIGFVGLIVPHVARLIAGADHRRLLPLALIGGATLMVGADLVARTALSPTEIPVGVVTAFIGGPFFLFLLRRSGRRAW